MILALHQDDKLDTQLTKPKRHVYPVLPVVRADHLLLLKAKVRQLSPRFAKKLRNNAFELSTVDLGAMVPPGDYWHRVFGLTRR